MLSRVLLVTNAGPNIRESSPRQYLEQRRAGSPEAGLWNLLDRVHDPELPLLSIWEMGMLRDVRRSGDKVVVVLSPTYSGCPAMESIEAEIKSLLRGAGVAEIDVRTELTPAWGGDWISREGMEKMRAWGIAPPEDGELDVAGLLPRQGVRCPHCGSRETGLISEFGSTPCKALFRCNQCSEPFDYFKRL